MTTQIQEKLDDKLDAAWARLASHGIRVALTRRDVSYSQLAEELTKLGLSESVRSVHGKVQRGTFRFTFFLQALVASRAEYPEHWSHAMTSESSWEERAAALLKHELSVFPWLDSTKLSHRLAEIGIEVALEALEAQLNDGTFTAALFFQCATVCRFHGTQLFLDVSELNEVAMLGVPAT